MTDDSLLCEDQGRVESVIPRFTEKILGERLRTSTLSEYTLHGDEVLSERFRTRSSCPTIPRFTEKIILCERLRTSTLSDHTLFQRVED